jgi:hypothetical protein
MKLHRYYVYILSTMKIINMLLAAGLCLTGSPADPGINSSKSLFADQTGIKTLVYLHTDRSCYLPGEDILFKAYFLDGSGNRSFPINDTLKIVLLDQFGIGVASGSFPVENNLISGSVELPDFLTEGSYILYGSTHSMKNPEPEKMFSRIIEVRKSFEHLLNADISLTDTMYVSGSTLTALIRFSDKDNSPVPAGFAYQMTGTSGEILNGNNKAGSEGNATLKLQLPKFDNKETLKLLVESSYKGSKTISGVVIPTRNNWPEKGYTKKLSSNDFRRLNIQLKTVNLMSENKDKVRLDISVTDENGSPVMANLSVSASNTVPHQLNNESDNLVNYMNQKNSGVDTVSTHDLRQYFTTRLLQKTQFPGRTFIVQEKNNVKKLHRKEVSDQKNQAGYSSDRTIFDILMQIKPYHIENNKITFGINSMTSVTSQDGALIIIDGIRMGTDISVLSGLSVPDIARITASTNSMDIQKYSAMNNVGIIEITMKKNKEFLAKVASEDRAESATLFWGSDIMTDSSGKASVTYFNKDNSSEVLITADGLAANGACGSSSIQYSINR